MVQSCADLQALKLDVGTKAGNQMVALSRLSLGRRFLQSGILFERLMINLDTRPSLVELRQLVVVERQITRHQIERACRSVLVCEDLVGQKQWEVDFFKPNLRGLACWQIEFADCLVATALFIF